MALSEESRLISMRILQNFVRETKGKWNDGQWKNLLQRVKKAGFEKVEEKRIRQLVDDNRERWLSGDNSVGAPPAAGAPKKKEEPKPAPKPAEAKKEEPKKPEPVGEKREEKRMPEPPKNDPKAGPPKAAPPKAAPPKAAPPKPAAAPPKPAAAPPKPAAPAAAAGGGPKSEAQKSDFILSEKDSQISSSQAQELHQRRLALLKRSQDLTKELSDTEIEIRRLENTQTQLQKKLDELEGTRDPLESERKKLQTEVDDVTKEISRLQENVNSLASQRSALEEGVGRRKKERSEHVAAIAHLKAEKESLIS